MNALRCRNPAAAGLLLLSTLLLLAPGTTLGQGPDQVGLYFDTGYTQNSLTTDALPAFTQAHLVLHEPSAAEGVAGWECWLRIEGPATLVGTTYTGTAINIRTPPFYEVGVMNPPLPGGDEVLLATFSLIVSDEGPVTLSLVPLFDASLPEQMAYAKADADRTLVPMTSATGADMAAWINASLDPVCDVRPDHINLGDVPLRTTGYGEVTVYNEGIVPLELDIHFPEGVEDFYLRDFDPGPRTVDPFDHLVVRVVLVSYEVGYRESTLHLGGGCPDVPVYGEVFQPYMAWDVPDSLNFGEVVVTQTDTIYYQVSNTGDAVFLVIPALESSCQAFSFGPTVIWIYYPGMTGWHRVVFAPTNEGFFACTMDMGSTVPPIELTGWGVVPDGWCVPDPADLAFGGVALGDSVTLLCEVHNGGEAPLELDPASDHPFFLATGPAAIPPGESGAVPITFAPLGEGPCSAQISLGSGLCAPVTCSGEGLLTVGWDEDVVGFAFDPAAMQRDYFDFSTGAAAGDVVTAYLVLVHPSVDEPVAGWECRAATVGPGVIQEWRLTGGAVNTLTEPDFRIRYSEPLPPAPYHVLAEADVYVGSGDEGVILTLVPPTPAMMPGQMTWLSGETEPRIMPMRTVTRTAAAGFINTNEGIFVGLVAPTPRATSAPGRVTLEWTIDPGDYDGCRLYRRVGDSEPQLLTSTPLEGAGTFRYIDAIGTQFGPAQLHYSYAVLRDGVEIARSSEVSVQAQPLPAAVTRLLPCVPNPFNPQTEVRFELEKAGPVQVTIYDVTGRRVRALVDETLSAGLQSRIWNGRNDAGQRVASGTYTIRLVSETRESVQKALLLK